MCEIFVGFELSNSSSLVFYKKMTTWKIKFNEIYVKSLGQPRSSLDRLRPSHNAGMCKTRRV